MAELIGGLWPEGREGQDLRVWTPDATALFKGLASQGPAAGETFSDIVEGRRALPLASLPAPLYQWLAAQLNRTPRLHLWLSAELPAVWQRCPYEWLTLDGKPLQARLQVCRAAPPHGGTRLPRSLIRRCGSC